MSLFGTNKKTHTTEATTSNTNNTATTTPNVPDWIADPSKNIAGQVGGILGQGAGAYAPVVSDLQKGAYAGASNLTPSPYYAEAGDALNSVPQVGAEDVTGQSLLTGLDNYYTPFKDQVLNPVLNDFDIQSGITRAAQSAAAARNKAFQGSRYGIQEGQTEGELARGRSATEGGLLGNMFTQATGLSADDAARRQAAMSGNQATHLSASTANASNALQRGSLLANLAASQGADARADLGIQAGLGAVDTDQQNALKQYPMTFLNQNEGLLSGLNPELYTGKTLTGTESKTGTSSGASTLSDPMSDIGKVAQIAAMFAGSDRRIKRDIRTVGWDAKGHRWVTFAYLWAPLKRVFGVIAQEAAKIDPEAVVVGRGGVLMVNYARLV